ncbi:siderophore-interacting protein [Ramlibacter rhizophilus]|uniref:Siderophore-interacting protein n=1 Tax=Ramlibacter rhizophilus TaxID=1781167 RepID=A0A4Z0BDL8_9BURK|nr:siderophore-interacting protein [Ramlibacter rhizophilus]TFY97415.1 siderophore-interacting protein [Ramlibacter rhizophilus]
MQDTLPARRIQRVRHELRRRELEVVRAEQPSPGFAAITLGGEALDGFHSPGFDDHLKFMFTPPGGADPVRRDFTPRRFDPGRRELVIEFALHEQGPASDWARQAAPGQRVTVAGPRGSMLVPLDYDWHLLAGDASALPAIHRRLEELPAGSRAMVLLQVDAADRRPLASAASLCLEWTDDAAAQYAALEAVVLPPGDGFIWCAGEAADMAALRKLLLVDKGHPRTASRIAAYWKRGAAEFHEELAD